MLYLIRVRIMNKQKLIRYISGNTSKAENEEIMAWTEKDIKNRNYLINLTNTFALLPSDNNEQSREQLYNFTKSLSSNKRKKHVKSILYYSAAAIFVLSIAISIYLIRKDNLLLLNTDSKEMIANISPDSLMQEIYVVKGAKSKIKLPDGSTVWLNSDSKIKFPYSFSGDTRKISFTGEAFFDIAKDPKHPMVISLNNNYCVAVLGTTFNLKSYTDENNIEATLFTGKINIFTQNYKGEKVKEICTMKPNEIFSSHNRINNQVLKRVDEPQMTKITAWKEGILYFDETPMDEVIKTLTRWHGSKFVVNDKEVLNYTITAKFDNESAIQILEMLKLCAPIDYTISDTTITLFAKK